MVAMGSDGNGNGYVDLADDAGLVYMTDEAPGYRRARRGRGFSYLGPNGNTVSETERDRIAALAVPPAWEQVWISPEPRAHILATGYDSAGRKQYVYHPVWEEIRDEVKFERTGHFGRAIARLRSRVDRDLRRHGLNREKVIALAVAVLDRTLIRVGNRRYAEANDSYGLTTLTDRHVEVNGHHVHFGFDGKGGAENQVAFEDRRLASLIARCQELNGQTLFSYETDGETSAIQSNDVNDYLTSITGSRFTAKDMRTWGATTLVAGELATASNDGDKADLRIREAIEAASSVLGNSLAVCRDSYVHPEIPDAFLDGRLHEAWRGSRRGKWLSRPESAVNRLLGNS
jgi:DNA topoisomerase-1